MSQAETANTNSSKLLIVIGVLWLLFGGGHLLYQLANPTVEIKWETATELNTAGFNLYRSQSADSNFTQINTEEGLIPSEGDAVSGAAYTYVDSDVEVGQTYHYLLEEVEYDQTTNRYQDDIFTYRVPFATGWTITITTVSVLIGLALLVTGLKEDRQL